MGFSAGYVPFFASICVLVLVYPSLALNRDGILLLSFKYSVLSDPLSVLESWNYDDQTPCSWNGVTCSEIGNPGTAEIFRLTGLVLPNSQLLGSVSEDLGFIEHLRHLDLSNNFFNGSLPVSIFNATELQVLSLSNNVISGELPETISEMKSLQVLNLSDNALAGKVPQNLTALQNLSVVSLRSNYFSGSLPGGFSSVEVLDLSSNLFNGSLPLDFGGDSLLYLNLSFNKISGSISPEFAKQIPKNSSIDLSFNNLTGAIPQSPSLLNQRPESFAGNVQLCGKPLKNLCSIPSSLSTPPNVSSASPAIAVIPRPLDSVPVTNSQNTPPNAASSSQASQSGLKPGTIAAIAVADLAGISLLALVILYVYQIKKRKGLMSSTTTTTANSTNPENKKQPQETTILAKTEKPATWSCLTIQGEETSEATTSSDSDQDNYHNEDTTVNRREARGGMLVTVDGESKLELETLFKASAYILGTSGSSIMYKAVLGDGTAFAVRRIGDSGVERLKDFESQVKAIAKLKHPNLVKVRGFYWGDEEKLVIYDYISNGNLATAGYRRAGSSPYHLSLETRLKIAKGLAKGLAYIHEKKFVHGNIKPTNILLNSNMEPVISDLGLDRLLSLSRTSSKSSNSSLIFGSQRSTMTSAYDHHLTSSGPHTPAGPSGSSTTSPYQAPESLRNLKPNPKWDVFSFGVVLLELFTGRVLTEPELGQCSSVGSISEERNRMLQLADVTIRADLARREEAVLACLKLWFNCASFAPQKRPSMKEALQILEKIPSSS